MYRDNSACWRHRKSTRAELERSVLFPFSLLFFHVQRKFLIQTTWLVDTIQSQLLQAASLASIFEFGFFPKQSGVNEAAQTPIWMMAQKTHHMDEWEFNVPLLYTFGLYPLSNLLLLILNFEFKQQGVTQFLIMRLFFFFFNDRVWSFLWPLSLKLSKNQRSIVKTSIVTYII